VWKKFFCWMQMDGLIFEDRWSHFTSFGSLVSSNKGPKVRHIIWLAPTRCLWRLCNNIMFRGFMPNLSSIVEQITLISWFWFLSRSGIHTPYACIDWCNNLLACLHSI
jgi:hypothetical protein